MTGQALREARSSLGLSQVEAAAQLGISQALLSLMENGERAITPALSKMAVAKLRISPELLPVVPDRRHNEDQLAADLGALRYPGYAYLRGQLRNPAEVLFDALDRRDLRCSTSGGNALVAAAVSKHGLGLAHHASQNQ